MATCSRYSFVRSLPLGLSSHESQLRRSTCRQVRPLRGSTTTTLVISIVSLSCADPAAVTILCALYPPPRGGGTASWRVLRVYTSPHGRGTTSWHVQCRATAVACPTHSLPSECTSRGKCQYDQVISGYFNAEKVVTNVDREE